MLALLIDLLSGLKAVHVFQEERNIIPILGLLGERVQSRKHEHKENELGYRSTRSLRCLEHLM